VTGVRVGMEAEVGADAGDGGAEHIAGGGGLAAPVSAAVRVLDSWVYPSGAGPEPLGRGGSWTFQNQAKNRESCEIRFKSHLYSAVYSYITL
jgi:hypothetical protein